MLIVYVIVECTYLRQDETTPIVCCASASLPRESVQLSEERGRIELPRSAHIMCISISRKGVRSEGLQASKTAEATGYSSGVATVGPGRA